MKIPRASRRDGVLKSPILPRHSNISSPVRKQVIGEHNRIRASLFRKVNAQKSTYEIRSKATTITSERLILEILFFSGISDSICVNHYLFQKLPYSI
jgi:hypothetical protein